MCSPSSGSSSSVRIVALSLVNLIDNPESFANVALIGLTNGSVYALVALGYTLIYGILQLINFAHGDVFALSGLVASTVMITLLDLSGTEAAYVIAGGLLVDARPDDGLRREHQRGHRAPRLPAAAEPAAPDNADQRGRHVIHRPEHLSRVLRRRVPRRSPADLRVAGLHDRQGLDELEQAFGRAHHDPGAS